MVHFLSVAELVYHHAVYDLRRRQHQETVKVQISSCTAASPAGLLLPYGDLSVGYADYGSIVSYPLRDVLFGFFHQFIDLIFGQGSLQRLPFGLLHFGDALFDPVFMAVHKGVYLSDRRALRSAHYYLLVLDLKGDGRSFASDYPEFHFFILKVLKYSFCSGVIR